MSDIVSTAKDFSAKVLALRAEIGKVVVGTVKGDIHDIGKNLVAMMLEGAGFEVVDLDGLRIDKVLVTKA